MQSSQAKLRAEQIFSGAHPTNTQDYEERAREIRRKIEYLRTLRLAAQARQRTSRSGNGSVDTGAAA